MTAVRPPEFFPRISYFGLIAAVDRFIMGDVFAYSRQSFQNRAPIRRPEGRMWLTLPVAAGSKGRPIMDVQLSETEYDAGRLWRALRFNYEATPFFIHYQDEIRDLLYSQFSLGEMTSRSIHLLARWLRIRTPIERLSDLSPASTELSDALQTTGGCYVSTAETFAHDSRITDVCALAHFAPPRYEQAFEGFEPDLSALDLLFNQGPDAAHVIANTTVLTPVEGSMKPGPAAEVD